METLEQKAKRIRAEAHQWASSNQHRFPMKKVEGDLAAFFPADDRGSYQDAWEQWGKDHPDEIRFLVEYETERTNAAESIVE